MTIAQQYARRGANAQNNGSRNEPDSSTFLEVSGNCRPERHAGCLARCHLLIFQSAMSIPMANPHHGMKRANWSLTIQLVRKESHAPTAKRAIANGVPHIAASLHVRFRRNRLLIPGV